MSENLRHYTTIVFGFEHVLRLVPESAWANASPCDEWNARQVAGHAMSVVNNIAARAGVGTVVDPFRDLDQIAGDDPLASFRRIRDRYLHATDRQGALQTRITSSVGEMTLDDYLGRMCPDTLIHTWDLARAAGVDDTLDPGSVSLVLSDFLDGDGPVRAPGRYAEALELGEPTSEQDRLIAYTGRNPRW
jgi:uncharacterized protein (TIGR03086 family)